MRRIIEKMFRAPDALEAEMTELNALLESLDGADPDHKSAEFRSRAADKDDLEKRGTPSRTAKGQRAGKPAAAAAGTDVANDVTADVEEGEGLMTPRPGKSDRHADRGTPISEWTSPAASWEEADSLAYSPSERGGFALVMNDAGDVDDGAALSFGGTHNDLEDVCVRLEPTQFDGVFPRFPLGSGRNLVVRRAAPRLLPAYSFSLCSHHLLIIF